MSQPDLARRGLLRGLAALPVVGTASIAVAAEPCPVAAAIDAYRAAETAHAEAEAAVVAAQLRLDAMPYPEIPTALLIREADVDLWRDGEYVYVGGIVIGEPCGARWAQQLREAPRRRTVTRPFPEDGPHATDRVRELWPEGQARADEIVAAHNAYEAAWEDREQASGLPAAHAAEDAACRRVQACGAAVAAAWATTAAGVLRKALMVMGCYIDRDDLNEEIRGCSTDRGVALSLARDLVAMGERSAA